MMLSWSGVSNIDVQWIIPNSLYKQLADSGYGAAVHRATPF